MVEIPFRDDMKKASIEGRKCCTSRNSKYGKPGDTFMIDGQLFVIKKISKMKLDWMHHRYYKEEGFDSPEAFRSVWVELHPTKAYDPEQRVWTHWYEKVV